MKILLAAIMTVTLASPSFAHNHRDRGRDDHREYRHERYNNTLRWLESRFPRFVPERVIVPCPRHYNSYHRPYDTEIDTYIDGEFNGFKDGAVWRMEDGSVWEQCSCQTYHCHLCNPRVVIYLVDCNRCKMSVDGVDETVFV